MASDEWRAEGVQEFKVQEKGNVGSRQDAGATKEQKQVPPPQAAEDCGLRVGMTVLGDCGRINTRAATESRRYNNALGSDTMLRVRGRCLEHTYLF